MTQRKLQPDAIPARGLCAHCGLPAYPWRTAHQGVYRFACHLDPASLVVIVDSSGCMYTGRYWDVRGGYGRRHRAPTPPAPPVERTIRVTHVTTPPTAPTLTAICLVCQRHAAVRDGGYRREYTCRRHPDAKIIFSLVNNGRVAIWTGNGWDIEPSPGAVAYISAGQESLRNTHRPG